MHHGWPDGPEIQAPAFVKRFARTLERHTHTRVSDAVAFWRPDNEISFHA